MRWANPFHVKRSCTGYGPSALGTALSSVGFSGLNSFLLLGLGLWEIPVGSWDSPGTNYSCLSRYLSVIHLLVSKLPPGIGTARKEGEGDVGVQVEVRASGRVWEGAAGLWVPHSPSNPQSIHSVLAIFGSVTPPLREGGKVCSHLLHAHHVLPQGQVLQGRKYFNTDVNVAVQEAL